MFRKIVVPVDLAHTRQLRKALSVAGELARANKAEICYIGVTTPAPTSVAGTPEEYGHKLADFAATQGRDENVPTDSHMLLSLDPGLQMNHALESAVAELGADLVVMATHIPNATDYVWSGHGPHMAAHSAASVFLVRNTPD